MKKALLFLIPFLAIGLFNKLSAQCTPYNFQSNIKSISVSPTTATVTLDVSFDLKSNNGNKYIFIHLWTGSDYQGVTFNWGASGQKAPTKADLDGATNQHPTLYNLAIDNSLATPVYKSLYVDPTLVVAVPVTPLSVTHLASGADSFVIRDVVLNFDRSKLDIPGDIIKGAIWSSNSSTYSTSSTSVQCFMTGASFLSDPVISGTSNCDGYSVTVTHNSLTQGNVLTGTYDVYVDSQTDGQLNTSVDNKIAASVPFSVTATDAVANYFTGFQTQPGTNLQYKGMNLFVRLTIDNSPIILTKFIPTFQCSTLPVLLQSFSATRSNQSVSVKWQTASEQNNRGFYVQRNVNGEWKDIAFVFSKADGGNSNEPLSYAYNDPNPLSSVSYYRVLQVDFDGRGKLSDIRIVKGLAEVSKLLMFPNPGSNGKINLLFQDEVAPKNVLIYDAAGRAVKSFKNVLSSNLTIDQLKPGVYSIQVINTTSQVVTSDKFIIKD
jgi:hypothetical protein